MHDHGPMRFAAVVATLAAAFHLVDPAGCSAAAKDCGVVFGSMRVEAGQAVGTVTPTCNQMPVEHNMQVYLQVQVAGEWVNWGRTRLDRRLPDATGFTVDIRWECRENNYRTTARIVGRGPVSKDAPNGVPFDYTESSWPKWLSWADCKGG